MKLNVRNVRFRATAVRVVVSLFAVAAVAAVGACGEEKQQQGSYPNGELQIWSLRDVQSQPVLEASIEEYNKTSKTKLVLTTYASDTYKMKMRSAMTSSNAPDIFVNWGGGNLAELVREKKVAELGTALSKNPQVFSSFMLIVLSNAEFDGVQYGLPMNGMQPAVLFYNNDVFEAAGARPPETYDELLALVDTFKARGIVPFALAGSQGWAELMYLEYILERVGGPAKFAAIEAGAPGAWQDPAVLKSVQMVQDLVKRGAFGNSFGSVGYDNVGASRLLATGKAAMHLMGAWEYGSQLTANPEFARSGSLRWVPFPTIAGGAGDVREIVGSPSNYFSVRADSEHAEVAIDFLMKTLASDKYIDGLIKGGQVPAIKGVDSRVSQAKNVNAEFATFTYQLVDSAPSFTQSWEQALTPQVAADLNTNLQKLFKLEITPEAFISTMAGTK